MNRRCKQCNVKKFSSHFTLPYPPMQFSSPRPSPPPCPYWLPSKAGRKERKQKSVKNGVEAGGGEEREKDLYYSTSGAPSWQRRWCCCYGQRVP